MSNHKTSLPPSHASHEPVGEMSALPYFIFLAIVTFCALLAVVFIISRGPPASEQLIIIVGCR